MSTADYILTIYELNELGMAIEFQQAAASEADLQATAVAWFYARFPDHFEEGMFHDSPSDSVADNYQAIVLWCKYATSSGGLDLIIRPADACADA